MCAMESCTLIFWLWLYEKIILTMENWQKGKNIRGTKRLKKLLLKFARWITGKRKYHERYKNKKIVKKIRAWGHFGLYVCGLLPFFMHIGLSTQKIFIRSKIGPLFMWLGALTRVSLFIFTGLRLIDFLISLIH